MTFVIVYCGYIPLCFFKEEFAKDHEKAFRIQSSIMSLQNDKRKNEVLKTTRETLTNNDVIFDNKSYVLAFNNVVFDLQEHNFRGHMYDDYTLTTTGYDWREPTEDEIKIVNALIEKVFPIKEEQTLFFLQIFATGLEGVALEKIIVQNGCGGNGKGLFNDCFLISLGNYGMIGNNSLLTDTHKTGANPELANIGGKRYVVFREVPERSRFENSAVKELTGGGNICARTLFEKTTTKNLYLTLVVEVNQKPKFKEEATQGDIRRLIDLLYRSTFTDNEQDVDPQNYIYPANPLYKSKEWQ